MKYIALTLAVDITAESLNFAIMMCYFCYLCFKPVETFEVKADCWLMRKVHSSLDYNNVRTPGLTAPQTPAMSPWRSSSSTWRILPTRHLSSYRPLPWRDCRRAARSGTLSARSSLSTATRAWPDPSATSWTRGTAATQPTSSSTPSPAALRLRGTCRSWRRRLGQGCPSSSGSSPRRWRRPAPSTPGRTGWWTRSPRWRSLSSLTTSSTGRHDFFNQRKFSIVVLYFNVCLIWFLKANAEQVFSLLCTLSC